MQPKDLPPNCFVNVFQIQDGAQNEDQNGRQNTFLCIKMCYTDIKIALKTTHIQNIHRKMALKATAEKNYLMSMLKIQDGAQN